MFKARVNAPRIVTTGKQPGFGGGTNKVSVCP